jgi:hypothetical protein
MLPTLAVWPVAPEELPHQELPNNLVRSDHLLLCTTQLYGCVTEIHLFLGCYEVSLKKKQ